MMLFLLYDEAELHWFIFLCILTIIGIYKLYENAKKQECHRKYLQYRVLAETLRVQYFITKAAIKSPITEIIPWFIKKDIPWIIETLPSSKTNEKKKPIINCWIRDQLKYHQSALFRSTKQKAKDDRIRKIVRYITLITYIIALCFEIYIIILTPGEINSDILSGILNSLQHGGIMVGLTPTDMIRSILKIVIGTMSAATLFTESYYGKLSLPEKLQDHRRMIMLYQKAENNILQEKKESENLILSLAHEFLIENTTWYAYQKKSKPDLTIE